MPSTSTCVTRGSRASTRARPRHVVDRDQERRLAASTRSPRPPPARSTRRGRRSRPGRRSSRPRRAGATRGRPCGPRRRTRGSDGASRECRPGRGRSSARRGSGAPGRRAGSARSRAAGACRASRSSRGRRRAATRPTRASDVGDPAVGGAVARGGDDLQVLAAGQVRVEARLLDDRADACERLARASPAAAGRAARPRRRSACVRPSSVRIIVVLPGAVRAEEAERDAGAERRGRPR